MAIRDAKQLGEVIRAARSKRGWRQGDLARRASMRQQIISEIENGVMYPRLDTILKVLAALDLDLSVVKRDAADFDPADY